MRGLIFYLNNEFCLKTYANKTCANCAWDTDFYFIVSGEINVYLVKIKVVSITSEMISYHFTIVTDTIYIFSPRFGQLLFSSLFQMWILPPLKIFEHLCFLTKVSSVGMHFLS